MAQLTKGKTFISGETVEPADMHQLVDAATISDIVDAEIKSDAAIAHSKLANITAGQVLLGNASNVPTATALTGDVTVNGSGVTAIGSSRVTTSMVADSAITAPKLSGAQTGSAPVFGCRAWAKFAGQSTNGACVVSASGNVTSVSRIASGEYEVLMTTALPNANYAVSGLAIGSLARLVAFTETTTTFRLEFLNTAGTAINPAEASFMVIG
jgi:hypothetical protein